MKKLFFLILFIILMKPGEICAQAGSENAVQPQDEQFRQVIEQAKTALEAEPANGDLMILIANNYAFQKKSDSALIYIRKAEQINYYNDDLFDAWLNILFWAHRYDALVQTTALAKQYNYSHTENLLRKQLIAYTELRAYEEGINLAEDPENKEYLKVKDISNIYSNLLMKRNTNVLSAFYSLDFFDHHAPQHLANIGYSFAVGKHTLVLRGNYADRFQMNDLQLESDFYLQLKNKSYMYFNYGYAFDATLFPQHRAGYEYYLPLKNKMEASLGGRFMSYANSQAYIATGHLEKYMGKHWVAFRPFYVFQKDGNSLTMLLDYRYYGENPLNYWGIEFGFGNSPDDNRYATQQNASFNSLEAYKVKVERNIMLNRISDIRIGIGYSREEFKTNTFRNRYLIELGYRFRLK